MEMRSPRRRRQAEPEGPEMPSSPTPIPPQIREESMVPLEGGKMAKIKVAGVGGAGGNAVNRMIEAGLKGVEFVAVNTDLQALRQSHAHQAIQIGCELTRGLGSGGDPRIGRKAVEEDQSAIADSLHGSDMIFITA